MRCVARVRPSGASTSFPASPDRPCTLGGVGRRESAAPRTSPAGRLRSLARLSVCGRSQTSALSPRGSFGSRRHSRAGPPGD
jgi:hypothetical protein